MPTINKRFLLKLMLALLLFAGSLVGAHTIQAERIPAALKRQADRADAAGKYDAETRYLQRYLEFKPDDVDVRVDLAETLRAHGGSPLELYRLYEKILRTDPTRTAQRKAAVEVCLRLRRYTDAAEHAEKYLEREPADTTVRLQWASAAAALGRANLATAAYEAALKYAPTDAAVYRTYIVYLTADANRPDEAKGVIDRMAAALPDSPEPFLARARFELSKPDAVPGPAVLADAVKALALAPKNAEALLLKAECLQRSRDVAGARDCLTAGLQEHPGDVRFVKRLAWLEINRGNPGRAVALLEDGLKAAKNGFEDLLVPLGDLLVQLGETARADEIVRTLESRKGSLAPLQAKYLKARLVVHRGNWPEAVKLLSQVRTEGQAYPGLEVQSNLLLALCHRQLGETDRERECLKMILDRDPRHAAARVALAQSYLNAGLFADALREYEDAARSPYSSGSSAAMVVRLRGLRLRGVGRGEEWAQLDRAAASLSAKVGPASSDPAELRAELFTWQGRPDKAVGVLRQEIARRPGNAPLWAKLIDATDDLFGTAAGFQVLDEAQAVAGDGPELRLARGLLAAKDPARLRPVELPDLQLDGWAEADRTQYLYGLVEIYDRLGDTKNLTRVYGLIARQRPKDPAAWFGAYQYGIPDAAAKILALEGKDGPTVALVNAAEAVKAGNDVGPALSSVVAAFGAAPHDVEACLAIARLKRAAKESEAALAMYERAVKLDPTGITPNRECLAFLAASGNETKLAAFLAKLTNDPRWVGDPVRRVVTTACLKCDRNGAMRLLATAGKLLAKDSFAVAWLGDAYLAAGMKPEAVALYEKAVASQFASADDWIRLDFSIDKTDSANATLAKVKEKLTGNAYWAYLAAVRAKPANGSLPIGLNENPADFFSLTRATLALDLSRHDRNAAVRTLDAALKSPTLRPEDVVWMKRSLGMVLADRGTPIERKRAYEILVTDPSTAGSTPDEKRTTAAVLASLARFLDGPERVAVLNKSASLLADVVAANASPRDKFLRFRVLRSIGDPVSRNLARALLNELIDPKSPNLDYLIAGLKEVSDLSSDVERQLAESFAGQLKSAFPGDFRAIAAVARYECLTGKIDAAVSLVDGYVRAEAGPLDAQSRSARAADLLDGLARMPVLRGGTTASAIVPVSGVSDPGGSPRRKLVDSAVSKYEGLILARPEAAAAAAALLAFDGRVAEALSLIEKHPALATRLKAAAGVAVLRAGPTSAAQAGTVKAWLDAAKAEEPDSIAVKLTEAEYLAHLQDYVGAEKVYDAVLAVDPVNVVALNNLAWLLAPYPAQAAKALALIDRAASQSGLTPELLDTRARIRIAARQTDLAEQDSVQALASEKTPLRYFHLAMARQAMTPPKTAESRAAFRTAIARGLAPYMVHPADLPVLRTFEAGN
ncbi:MAG TPA: hypothetical protein VGJ05_18175 [Fimbriiglobus sp.]